MDGMHPLRIAALVTLVIGWGAALILALTPMNAEPGQGVFGLQGRTACGSVLAHPDLNWAGGDQPCIDKIGARRVTTLVVAGVATVAAGVMILPTVSRSAEQPPRETGEFDWIKNGDGSTP